MHSITISQILVASLLRKFRTKHIKYLLLEFLTHLAYSKLRHSIFFYLINDLNVRKGNRVNDIPAKVIKLSGEVISPFLSDIFNRCMSQGCYPDQLKIAHVIPIHKKGSKVDCSNFRPISLLCNFNRLFEKILYDRIYKYFDKFSLLNFHQYGFRKNHSTSMAIYDILESKLGERDKGKTNMFSLFRLK